MLERYFRLTENHTTIRREIAGGTTTFLAMSYIIFLQPALLSTTGMDFGAVMTATCVASAFATLLMALTANYPIALAPGMGHNTFFAFTVCGAMGVAWQTALGANLISGALFIALALFGLREKIIAIVPDALRYAIAAGIGMFIALLGLEWSGLVVDRPNILVGLGRLGSAPVLVSLGGLAITSILIVRKAPGALLLGILATALIGLPAGMGRYHGIVAAPPSLAPTLLQLDVLGALKASFLPIIFVFFFLDLFDTVGTLIGVGERGGFMREGHLPRARQALLSDAIGTVAGTVVGTSTITSFIESTAGIALGARTGLASVVTALLFIVALFFSPLVQMVGGGYETEEGVRLYPLIAPALILVGVYMMGCVRRIDWDDMADAIPAFLTMMIMTLSLSITEGIAFGFISFSALKIATGRWREAHWLLHLFALLFVLRYVFL